MPTRYTVYGQRGTGSVPVEATLTLLVEPYHVIERTPRESPNASDMSAEAMAKINPMWQVPALALPSGELMTESAAILIHLADSHPESHLAPALNDPLRPPFLRWMAFVASQIYALVWIRDDPSRLVPDPALHQVIMARTADRIAHCWGVMDAQVNPGRYILGDMLTVLDLYVTTISYWGPGRARFSLDAPKMWQVIARVDDDVRLVDLWSRRLG